MKRIFLILTVLLATAWIIYSSYELWINKDNTVNPEFVFCQDDQAILLINKFEETKDANYFALIQENPLAASLEGLDSLISEDFKIYASGNRPIIIFEKDGRWTEKELNLIKNRFKLNNLTFKKIDNHVMVALSYKSCEHSLSKGFFLEGDKKASANYWTNTDGTKWKRTDVYNLSKGLFEYRSSEPKNIYGTAVKDIPLFSSQIPISSTSYSFQERFYAEAHDSIFKNGPMNHWVDLGFVTITYDNHPVVISDYRSQQVPSLILIEQTKVEDSIKVKDDIHSFSGFQLTKDFPSKKNGRFYTFEIEDKVLFTESENVARKIQVDYQLGKTLSLSPQRQEHFFGGLPSYTNMRSISAEKKSSLTWKDKLSFEVNTLPPSAQFTEVDKNTWSVTPKHKTLNLVPIPDHLRNGTSILSYSTNGEYELYSPNGKLLWKGDLKSHIEDKVEVIDLFGNEKHQFLFHTKDQIHLIDLNGKNVGNFPYRSEVALTSKSSNFEWNNTKRFLIGNEKGEIIMLNSSGQELNIIQSGKNAIISTPYALNVKGNLRAWAVNSDMQQFLGYLENPAKSTMMNRVDGTQSVKYNGKIITYFEKGGKVFMDEYNSKNDREGEVKLVETGRIRTVTDDFIIIAENNYLKVLNHSQKIIYTKHLPFNEVGDFIYLPEKKISIALDYLQNKIHAYSNTGEELNDFPKEGREIIAAHYNEQDKTLYIYTVISQSIICYKINF